MKPSLARRGVALAPRGYLVETSNALRRLAERRGQPGKIPAKTVSLRSRLSASQTAVGELILGSIPACGSGGFPPWPTSQSGGVFVNLRRQTSWITLRKPENQAMSKLKLKPG